MISSSCSCCIRVGKKEHIGTDCVSLLVQPANWNYRNKTFVIHTNTNYLQIGTNKSWHQLWRTNKQCYQLWRLCTVVLSRRNQLTRNFLEMVVFLPDGWVLVLSPPLAQLPFSLSFLLSLNKPFFLRVDEWMAVWRLSCWPCVNNLFFVFSNSCLFYASSTQKLMQAQSITNVYRYTHTCTQNAWIPHNTFVHNLLLTSRVCVQCGVDGTSITSIQETLHAATLPVEQCWDEHLYLWEDLWIHPGDSGLIYI